MAAKRKFGRPSKYPPAVLRQVAKKLQAGVEPSVIASAPIRGTTVSISKVYEVRRRLEAESA